MATATPTSNPSDPPPPPPPPPPPRATTTSTGTCTLLLFASASTYCTNTDSLTIPAPTTLFALLSHLERTWPGVARKVLRSCQVVVNLDYVEVEMAEVVDAIEGEGNEDGKAKKGDEVKIAAGDEVAIVPPVSSG